MTASFTAVDIEQDESSSSDALCRRALDVYRGLFRRLPIGDFDTGFDESFAAGREAIEQRSGVEPYQVDTDALAGILLLFDMAESLADGTAMNWFDDFPQAFLDRLDRRQRNPSFAEGSALNRRYGDRRAERGAGAR